MVARSSLSKWKMNVVAFPASVFIGTTLAMLLLFAVQWLSIAHREVSLKPSLTTISLVHWQTESTAAQSAKPKPKVKPKPKPKLEVQKPVPVKETSTPLVSPSTLALAKKSVSSPQPQPAEPSLVQPVPLFKLSQLPHIRAQVQAKYPDEMRALGKTGTVKLQLLVDKTGKVRKVTVLQSAGEAFDQAAKKAALASEFEPAQADGHPVAVLWQLSIKFELL